jgi:hypothetical protein
LRILTAILALGTLSVISTSAAVAGGAHSRGNGNATGWLASIRHAAPPPAIQLDASRSHWFATRNDDREHGAPQWIKNSDNLELKHTYIFKDRDEHWTEHHSRFMNPGGGVDPVPEPSGLIALAGPTLGSLLYWRRRRSA